MDRHYHFAHESAQDPAITHLTEIRLSLVEGALSQDGEEAPHSDSKTVTATGKHDAVRSTGTEGVEQLAPIADGSETLAHDLPPREPEDPLPDQRDTNK